MFGRLPNAASNVFNSPVPNTTTSAFTPRTMQQIRHRSHLPTTPAHRVSGGFRALGAILLAMFCAASVMVKPSHAQVQVQTVVVLDFSVAPGLDTVLGRKAADALAVELQRSGDYEVVPRQAVEQAITTQPGLAPPYNESTQARLAQAVTARGVFSGQVLAAQINGGRSARVLLEVRLLDGTTQDYVNGTQVSESTEDQLTQMTAEVLIDQALNKAAVTAVRRIKQQPIPAGTVLNTTVSDAELNVGSRVGAAVGQRFAVLRDVYNRSKDRVERIKIGEVVISRVEMDQSVARILGDNVSGVKTGDKVRLIFAPTAYPVSPTTGQPVPSATIGGQTTSKGRSKAGGLLGGVGAIALLAGVFGLGGSGDGGNPPGGVTAQASVVGTPAITVNFSDGVPRLTVPRECILGYFIYRGESSAFSTGTNNLLDYEPTATTSYQDDARAFLRHTVAVDASNVTTGSDPCPPPATNNDATVGNPATDNSTFAITQDTIDSTFNQTPLRPGVQYFYRVRRVTTDRRTTTNGTTVTINYNLALSTESNVSGGATALIKPEVLRTTGTFDTNFAVTINGLSTVPNTPPIPAGQAGTIQVPSFADSNIRFLIRLSNDPTFATFFEVPQPNKTPEANGEINFNLGAIQATGVDPSEQVYIRVAVTNPTDAIQRIVVGDRSVVTFGAISQGARTNTRRTGRSNGVRLPGSPVSGIGSRGAGGNRRTPASIVRH